MKNLSSPANSVAIFRSIILFVHKRCNMRCRTAVIGRPGSPYRPDARTYSFAAAQSGMGVLLLLPRCLATTSAGTRPRSLMSMPRDGSRSSRVYPTISMQYAYCHCVDVFVWTVVGSVAGVACAVTTVIFGVLPFLRRRREASQPEISSELGPPVASGDGPVVVGDIPEEPPGFQPRTDLLALLDATREGSRIVVVHAVTGMRGVGKTQLAAAYARMRLAERWRLVGWVNAEDPGTLLAHLAEVAAKWGLEAADVEAAGRAIRHRLETDGERCLLVLNNVIDPELVQPFLPVSGESRVILTE